MKRFHRSLAGFLLLCLLFSGCGSTVLTTAPDTTLPETTLSPLTTGNAEALTTGGDPAQTAEPETTAQTPETTVPEATVPVQTAPPTTQGSAAAPSATGLTVHFIDVGQADAALVLCDGKAMLIDGGNADDSNLIYAYLQKLSISHLDYIVATHAHEDHVGGLSGALNYATVGQVFCPVTSYSSKTFQNFVKNVEKQGKTLTVPSVGQSFSLGSAACRVLAVNTDSDTNNTSIVLKITYGSTTFLFTADGEREVEQAMLDRGESLSATVLKVGHHGSSTSTSYAFLWQVMPEYAVISCGKNNSYGHPHDAVLSRLRDADVTLFRTDLQGDIICTSNGSTVSFTVSRNANANVFGDIGANSTTRPAETESPSTEPPQTTSQPQTEGTSGTTYILNTNSHKFHLPGCSAAERISDKNREEYTGSREELIDEGYEPCKLCDP